MWLWKNLARCPVENMPVAFRRPSGSFLWRDHRRRSLPAAAVRGPAPQDGLVGVAPFARNSGTLKGGRHIGGGRRRPRDVACMAALPSGRRSPDMRELYDRLRGRGKPHRVALVAVMRRLVVTANALLRDRRVWEDRTEAATA